MPTINNIAETDVALIEIECCIKIEQNALYENERILKALNEAKRLLNIKKEPYEFALIDGWLVKITPEDLDRLQEAETKCFGGFDYYTAKHMNETITEVWDRVDCLEESFLSGNSFSSFLLDHEKQEIINEQKSDDLPF